MITTNDKSAWSSGVITDDNIFKAIEFNSIYKEIKSVLDAEGVALNDASVTQLNEAIDNKLKEYALIGHTHPLIDHNHDDRYSKLGHIHDDRYSKLGHTHDGFGDPYRFLEGNNEPDFYENLVEIDNNMISGWDWINSWEADVYWKYYLDTSKVKQTTIFNNITAKTSYDIKLESGTGEYAEYTITPTNVVSYTITPSYIKVKSKVFISLESSHLDGGNTSYVINRANAVNEWLNQNRTSYGDYAFTSTANIIMLK